MPPETPKDSTQAHPDAGKESLRRFASTPEERYSVRKRLGAGGMATVYDAHDHDLRRHIAIKILKDEHRNSDGSGSQDRSPAQRFIEEAQITGQLQHPNIVPVHEIGYDSSGRLFFTMKRVQGATLGEILDAMREGSQEALKKYSFHRLVDIFIKICDAIRFAHAQGVLHRDIKPDNIMVGRFGEVQVMDWGLAKVIKERGIEEADTEEAAADSSLETISGLISTDGGSPLQTVDGTISGTPAYMPPEQARGETAKIDERTDIFLLGAMLYEMITLIPPFSAESSRRALHRAQQHELLDPKTVIEGACKKGKLEDGSVFAEAAQKRVKHFPRGLAAIAMHALEEESKDRYPSVKALVEDVRAWRADQTLSVYRAPFYMRVIKWGNRNRTASIAIIVILAAVFLVGGVVSVTRQIMLEQENDHLEQTSIDQKQIADQAHNLNRELEDRARLERERGIREAVRLERLEKRDVSKNFINSASNVLWRAASIVDPKQRQRATQEALAIALQAREADPTFPTVYVWLGKISFDLGRIVDARRYLLESIDVADATQTSTDFSTFLTSSTMLLSEGVLFMLPDEVWIPKFLELMQRALASKDATPQQRALAQLFADHMPRMLRYSSMSPVDPERESLAAELRADAERFLNLRETLNLQGQSTYWELSLMAAWHEVQAWRYSLADRIAEGPTVSLDRAKGLIDEALDVRAQLPIAWSFIAYLEVEMARTTAALKMTSPPVRDFLTRHRELWQEYVRRFPFDGIGYYSLAESETRLFFGRGGDTAKAITLYQRAIDLAPNLLYALASQAEAYEKLGNRQAAVKAADLLRERWRPELDFPLPKTPSGKLWRTPMARTFSLQARGAEVKAADLLAEYQRVVTLAKGSRMTRDYYAAVLVDTLRLYQLVDEDFVGHFARGLGEHSPWVQIRIYDALIESPLESAHAAAKRVLDSLAASVLDGHSMRAEVDSRLARRGQPRRNILEELAKADGAAELALLPTLASAAEGLSIADLQASLMALRDRYLASKDASEKIQIRSTMVDLYTVLVSIDAPAAEESCAECQILDGFVEQFLRTPGIIGHSDRAR